MRALPRWLMVIVWAIFLPAVYAAFPYYLSLSALHHGWIAGGPGLLNDLGLIGVIVGASIVGWVMLEHFRNIPREGARLGNPFQGPGYVLTKGPYGFCRHPMHLGTLSIWFGWALFYGSSAVLIGAAIILAAVISLVPSEERGMLDQIGEPYRRYMEKVPRWGFGRRSSHAR